MDIQFKDILDFHGCYCLDIAMGYRVALALKREMQGHLENAKEVAAQIGNVTCATDAIQMVLGCTSGKRNLYFMQTGKPVYILQNNNTGKAVRAYVHFWDDFDQSVLHEKKLKAKSENASDQDKQALQAFLKQNIEFILMTDEDKLFTLRHLTEFAPIPTVGKFETQACACCGEFTKLENMSQKDDKMFCSEC